MKFDFILKCALVFTFAIALTGCGGGENPNSESDANEEAPVINVTPPGKNITAGYLGIGAAFWGQSPAANDLPSTSETRNGEFMIRSDNWRGARDGSHSANEVIAYLKSFQIQEDKEAEEEAREPIKLVATDTQIRESKRILRLYGANEDQKELVREAVAEINAALPYNMRITIGQDLPRQIVDLTEAQYAPAGKIHLHFTHGKSSWTIDDYDTKTLGFGGVAYIDCDSTSCATSGFAFIDIVALGSEKEDMLWVLKHELLHAYGIVAHADPDQYPDSVLNPILVANSGNKPPIYLSIDGEVILALTRISSDVFVDDLSPSDLGNWTAESFHLLGYAPLSGSNSFVQFGVGWRNGLAKPWAYGPKSETTLQNNTDLSGTATWNGKLLGFSSQGNTVAGDAQIEINLNSMDGDTDFTDLEYWAGRTHPKAPGSGQNWGDDLRYSVEVSQGRNGEDIFFSTSALGDSEGSVSGNFVGSGHEGATGILEHPDLSAAFGTIREN